MKDKEGMKIKTTRNCEISEAMIKCRSFDEQVLMQYIRPRSFCTLEDVNVYATA